MGILILLLTQINFAKESKDLTFNEYMDLGVNTMNSENCDIANLQFEKALEKANTTEKKEEVYFSIAYNFNMCKQYDNAVEAYNKIIKINPYHKGVYYSMGISYTNKKEYDNAIEAYKKEIELN